MRDGPDSGHPPTVLVEHPSSLVLLDHREELEAAGLTVLTCRGPAALPGRVCPLVTGETCPLVEAADVIVNALIADQARVLAAQRTRHPDTPVLLVADRATGERIAGLLTQVRRLPPTVGGRELARALHALTANRAEAVEERAGRPGASSAERPAQEGPDGPPSPAAQPAT